MSRDKYNSLTRRECERVVSGDHKVLTNKDRANKRLAGMKNRVKK